jgi:lycopene beta-cyclase
LRACLQVFLEETSLVARPAVDFPDLKERLDARMKHLGIKVGGEGLSQAL